MDRFYGYNRDDYYFKRSCREAFGSDFYYHHKEIKLSTILIVVSFTTIVAILASFL